MCSECTHRVLEIEPRAPELLVAQLCTHDVHAWVLFIGNKHLVEFFCVELKDVVDIFVSEWTRANMPRVVGEWLVTWVSMLRWQSKLTERLCDEAITAGKFVLS